METVIRTACRALIVTPENEILLIRIVNPNGSWDGWITPGGGIHEGETHEKALRRELLEELGLKRFAFEGPVWTRFHKFEWGDKMNEQSEFFYLVLLNRFEPKPTIHPKSAEMKDFRGFRWWKISDVIASPDVFAPRNLGQDVEALIRHGIPEQPINVSDDSAS